MSTVTSHEFSLIVSEEVTEDLADALYAAGCDDALVSVQHGISCVDFEREADSFEEAVLGAIRDVESTGLKVSRVEPDDLVNTAEIARRTGRSRESIRLLARGERGLGDFPPPISGVITKSPVWRWAEVAKWFAEREDRDSEDAENASILATINDVLHLRLHGVAKTRVDGLWRQLSGRRKRGRAGRGGAGGVVVRTKKKARKVARKKAKSSARKRSSTRGS